MHPKQECRARLGVPAPRGSMRRREDSRRGSSVPCGAPEETRAWWSQRRQSLPPGSSAHCVPVDFAGDYLPNLAEPRDSRVPRPVAGARRGACPEHRPQPVLRLRRGRAPSAGSWRRSQGRRSMQGGGFELLAGRTGGAVCRRPLGRVAREALGLPGTICLPNR